MAEAPVDRGELLEKVMEFCMRSQFEQDFEAFAADKAPVFIDAGILEMDDENTEWPLSFHDTYLDYLRKFEGKIERFIESTGSSLQDFMRQAREILEDSETYSEQKFFLEALLATSEFENYMQLMRGEMHKYAHPAGGAESKADDGGGEGKSHK